MWRDRIARVDPRALLPHVLTAAALVALSASTVMLANAYHDERERLAAAHFSRGVELRRVGRGQEAIPYLRMALSLERHNDAYTLALTETLISLDRPAEAATYLTELLRRDPTSGIGNLLRARIARSLGRPDRAETHYQRAIYGSWPVDRSPTVAARFELAELLLAGDASARTRARAVAAELRISAPRDPETRRRVARLLLTVGLPEQASEELRDVLRESPEDGEAWALLSEAELVRENYTATRAAARRAVALGTGGEDAKARLALAERVLALDPTGPRLSVTERARRARALLQEAVTQLDGCTGDPALLSAEERDARARAARLLAAPRSRQDIASLVEVAEQLWHTRQRICPGIEADPALVAVFGRLGAEAEP